MSFVNNEFDFSAMPLHERAILAHQLLESVQAETTYWDLSPEQIAEAEQRIAEFDRGDVRGFTVEEVKAYLLKLRQHAT